MVFISVFIVWKVINLHPTYHIRRNCNKVFTLRETIGKLSYSEVHRIQR